MQHLSNWHDRSLSGEFPETTAQAYAKEALRTLRYGPYTDEYFFIITLQALSIMHPLRKELEGTDMSAITDPTGKHYLAELVRLAQTKGSGFLEYTWYARQDHEKRVRKLSSRNDLNGREPSYWRSLRELHDSGPVTDIKAHEFMSGVTDEFNLSDLSTMSRKQFLALLTASAAFAAAGCTNYRDKGEIVPYVKKPEEFAGVANLYASTCTGCAQSCGILIKTREGRPIKIDGNPDHPVNRGKICAKGQASILNLYDPNRLRKPARGSSIASLSDVSWKQADAEIRKHLEACTASPGKLSR